MSGNACSIGKQQSPINIDSSKVTRCGAMCDLMIYYRTSKCNLVNSGNEIFMDYDNGSYITFRNQVFELDRISFTVPASHRVDNYAYPGEIHLHHRSPDTGEVLIIAVFLDINDAPSKSNAFLATFADIMPKERGATAHLNTEVDWNVYNLIPEGKSFYTYNGSLPRSPCTERVTWIVMENPVNCGSHFFDRLKSIYPSNARALQNVNNRVISYNVNSADKNKRNYGDKLRCYTDTEFRDSCAKLTSHKDIVNAKNRQILLLTLTMSTLVIMTLLILWLVQQDFFITTLENIKKFLSTKVFLTPPRR